METPSREPMPPIVLLLAIYILFGFSFMLSMHAVTAIYLSSL